MILENIRYANKEKTAIHATLDGSLVSIPVAAGNKHYDEIVEKGLSVADYVDTSPPPTYIEQRRPEYRKRLATLKGEPGMDEVGVIGFQLDAIYTQLVTLAGGAQNMTPEMQGIITEVQAVKAKFPKP